MISWETRNNVPEEEWERAIFRGSHLGLRAAAQVFLGKLRAYSMKGDRDGHTTALHARTGTLARSWTVKASEEYSPGSAGVGMLTGKVEVGQNDQGEMGRVPYARIHEFGGVIVPVNRKFLAYPRPGSAAETALARVKRQRGPRQFPHKLHYTVDPEWGRSLATDDGEVQFLLRKKSVIRGRGYVRAAFDEGVEPALKIFRHHLFTAMARVGRGPSKGRPTA